LSTVSTPVPQQVGSKKVTKRKRSRAQWREAMLGYLYISPWIVGYLLLILGPVLASLYLSLTRYSVISPPIFIGLENYTRAFTTDQLFSKSMWNTFYFVIISVPISITTSLMLALLLDQGLRATKLFRTLFFLPSITPVVASVMLWRWIFQPDFGVLNYSLSLVGIEGPRWLASLAWVKPSLIIIALWGSVGGSQMIVFLAGLQSIPTDLYEVASIDGASRWHRFWRVTMPLLTPSIFFNLILGIIAGFRTFTAAYIATGGGPAYESLFFVLYLFYNAFEYMSMGYASAMAWVLLVIVLTLTAVQVTLSKRWVYYEAGD
jgi:multiple sugar transport system permease protein